MAARVLVTGIWHETNSFAQQRTDLAAFHAYQYAEGDAMRDAFAATNTEIGGMIGAAAEQGLELKFGLFAGAVPSGMVTRSAFETLLGETLRRATEAGPLDGVLLALHGAMVVDGVPDPDAEIAVRLRHLLGPAVPPAAAVPLVATFDIHANLSPRLVAATDLLIGYDTYPHTDMAERGAEAASLLARILATGRRPAKAFRKLPLLTAPETQATDDPPMRDLISALHEEEQAASLWTASIAVGFPYADVPQLGVAVVAHGEGGAADAAADRLAKRVWERRSAFRPSLVAPEEAVRRALEGPHPAVLVDSADNVGGGAPGDGTVILEALLRAGATSAVIVLWAPDAAARCVDLGVGGTFRGEVGGSDGRHGPALEVEGPVRFAAPVAYRRQSSYMTGQTVDLGRCAVVEVGRVLVVLTERRAMPFDGDHLRAVGIVPEEQRVLVCKSAVGWRAAFGDIARQHVMVDTPGIAASDLTRLPYTHGGHRMAPLDPDARWPG